MRQSVTALKQKPMSEGDERPRRSSSVDGSRKQVGKATFVSAAPDTSKAPNTDLTGFKVNLTNLP